MEPFIVLWALIAALTLGGASHEIQKDKQKKADDEKLYKHMEILSYSRHGQLIHKVIKEK